MKISVVFGLLLFLSSYGWCESPVSSTNDIRLAVLAYEDFEGELDHLRNIAETIKKRNARSVNVRFAFGNYTDILHWMERGTVDAAVIGPGMHAAMRERQELSKNWRYVANEYHSYANPGIDCFTNAKGKNLSVAELRGQIERHELEVVVVDPFSASGTIAPLLGLMREGVSFSLRDLRFSYSHSNSLRLLGDNSRPRLACVWRGSIKQPNITSPFQQIQIPAINLLKVPSGVVLVREGSLASELLPDLMPKIPGGEFRFAPTWEDDLDLVTQWRREVLSKLPITPSGRVGLSDLVTTFLRDMHASPDPTRIALVLAGGGSKCAYQAGAIRAIEEELERGRKLFNEPRLDFDLIVGTSGGAINAIATALGKTSNEKDYRQFVDAWSDLDQREILMPPRSVRWNLSVWFFAIEAFLVGCIPGLWRHRWFRQLGLPGLPSLIFALMHAFIAYLPMSPWVLLGPNPVLHKLWLWAAFGSFGTMILHLLFFFAIQFRIQSGLLTMRRWKWCVVLGFLAVGLPAVQAWNIGFVQESLVDSRGIEAALDRNFGKLVAASLEEKAPGSSQQLRHPDIRQRIKTMGELVVSQNLLKHDLVLTTSPLGDPNQALPGEFYWYLPATPGGPEPKYGVRGAALAKRPELLFDIMMGSAAIYPVFPPRMITDFPTPGKKVELVDGSFAHRSPLEAALEWGATHVIVIEAATEEAVPRGNLLFNVGAALSYLYDQAQLTDVRARGQTKLFTLVPTPPHIGLLDFADNLVITSIEKGFREAKGDLESGIRGAPTFREQLGEPVFWDPVR